MSYATETFANTLDTHNKKVQEDEELHCTAPLRRRKPSSVDELQLYNYSRYRKRYNTKQRSERAWCRVILVLVRFRPSRVLRRFDLSRSEMAA